MLVGIGDVRHRLQRDRGLLSARAAQLPRHLLQDLREDALDQPLRGALREVPGTWLVDACRPVLTGVLLWKRNSYSSVVTGVERRVMEEEIRRNGSAVDKVLTGVLRWKRNPYSSFS